MDAASWPSMEGMKLDHSTATATVADMMRTLSDIGSKHSDDEIGKLVDSTIRALGPSIGRLKMAERKSSSAALASIASATMMTVASAVRRRNLLDGNTETQLRSVALGASALLDGRKIVPRKSMPHRLDPPAEWKHSRLRIGGFERRSLGGRKMHITKDIHVHGTEWILHFDGIPIDALPTIEGAVAVALDFDNFMGTVS